ncbi:hypothetical protein I302_105245 [Kwoniella bestiolae CBS 10118]|uniref:Uncharacterized protein n=1 Tax=Kwoniella bestiolae CBS 10118 TaxID=1296100 RepID=A0A1B9FSL5_9TREE|nr:hypothetical protein I302_08533 [Kwoniella bestiolae CBS 10118]OCF21755.1 hypothetical protein I302_08533 [Kwoniella bestiolae CBS 10118]
MSVPDECAGETVPPTSTSMIGFIRTLPRDFDIPVILVGTGSLGTLFSPTPKYSLSTYAAAAEILDVIAVSVIKMSWLHAGVYRPRAIHDGYILPASTEWGQVRASGASEHRIYESLRVSGAREQWRLGFDVITDTIVVYHHHRQLIGISSSFDAITIIVDIVTVDCFDVITILDYIVTIDDFDTITDTRVVTIVDSFDVTTTSSSLSLPLTSEY